MKGLPRMFNEKINFAIETIYAAGKMIKSKLKDNKENIEITVKTCISDLVTNIDHETEEFIVEKITQKYPSHTFITEEKTVTSSFGDKCWIIDPIDGTLNFIYEQKNYAISAAYYEFNRPVFGIIYDVWGDNMYLGIKGKGAYLNGEKIIPSFPCDLKNSIVDVNFKRKNLIKQISNIDIEELCNLALEHRHLGSAAIRICDVARGRIHVYISPHLKLWDYAAGNIILAECGGNFHTIKYDGNLPSSSTFFIAAQNDDLLKEVLSLSH